MRPLRNTHSGRCYFRPTHNGKQKWLSMKTDFNTLAKKPATGHHERGSQVSGRRARLTAA
jgi:hypothetical protein